MIAEPNRNRRASASLSPVFIHFIPPQGKLYQRILALEHVLGSIPPILTVQQHPGPREPQFRNASTRWNMLRFNSACSQSFRVISFLA